MKPEPEVKDSRPVRLAVSGIVRDSRAKLLLVATVLVLLFRQSIAAPIRAYVPSAWYLPDLLLGVGLLAFVYLAAKSRIQVLLWASLAFGVLIGLSLLTNPPVSVAVSARQVLYLFMAVLCGYIGSQGRAQINKSIIALALIATAGVYLDHFIRVPWAGMRFSGALDTVDVSREWWGEGGTRRLAGFGLASTDTSVIIAAGMLVMLGTSIGRIRMWQLGAFAAAVYAILLTTQRSTAIAFSAVSLLLITATFSRALIDPRSLIKVLKVATIAALVTAVLAPVFLYGFKPSDLGISAPTLQQRTSEVWPTVIAHLVSSVQTFFGFGFGAVGETGGVESFRLVDNAFLYATISFGLFGAIAMFAWAGLSVARARIWDTEDVTALAVICLCAINGITANVIAAGGVATVYVGIAIGTLSRPRRKSQVEAPTLKAFPTPRPSRAPPTRRAQVHTTEAKVENTPRVS
jgi:hypothetical protein